MMDAADSLLALLRAQLIDCETQWSVGTFGALAEFTRDRQEAAEISRSGETTSVVTDRGGIRIRRHPDIRLVASESVTRENWNHRIALCLPQGNAAVTRRDSLTELGPDADALRDGDRDSILFDLGLGAVQVEACIRVSEPTLAAELRAYVGRNVFATDNPVMRIIVPASPHRVFISRMGRIEVFQPIPPPGGHSPEGPHTHVLPRLLRHQRTHAATEQIPDGYVPCAHFYPPHPAKDTLGRMRAFDRSHHELFQDMLRRFGNEDAIMVKHQVLAAIENGAEPSALAIPDSRFARANIRIALRQLKATHALSPTLALWLRVHDRPHVESGETDDTDRLRSWEAVRATRMRT